MEFLADIDTWMLQAAAAVIFALGWFIAHLAGDHSTATGSGYGNAARGNGGESGMPAWKRQVRKEATTRLVLGAVALVAAGALLTWMAAPALEMAREDYPDEYGPVMWLQVFALLLFFLAPSLLVFLPAALYRVFARDVGGCSLTVVIIGAVVLAPLASGGWLSSTEPGIVRWNSHGWWIYTLVMIALWIATEAFRLGRAKLRRLRWQPSRSGSSFATSQQTGS